MYDSIVRIRAVRVITLKSAAAAGATAATEPAGRSTRVGQLTIRMTLTLSYFNPFQSVIPWKTLLHILLLLLGK